MSLSEPGQQRISSYRLLARLALAEVSAELAESLRELPIFGPALSASGGRGGLQALRADYAHAFLMNAHPYESVYLDESGMLNAEASASVLGHYAEHAFESPALRSSGAPDHLGLELQFMAHLAARAAAAARIGQRAVSEHLAGEQLHFLEAHLARWSPLFGAVLGEVAATPFYRVYGQAVGQFVLDDLEQLAAVVDAG